MPPVRLVQLPEGTGLQAWLAQFRAYRAVVSARYHGLAFGALAGKPLLALAVDPKLVALTHELGLEGGSLEPPFDPVQVRQAVARLLDEGRPPRPEAVAHLRTRAQEGLEGLVRLARALAEPATAAPRLSWRDRRFPVLGLPIDPVSLDEAVAIISEWCEGEGPARQVITSNPELVMHAQTPGEEATRLREVMTRADLIVADGVGLVWAARFLGYALPGRVAGADLAERLCRGGGPAGLAALPCGAASPGWRTRRPRGSGPAGPGSGWWGRSTATSGGARRRRPWNGSGKPGRTCSWWVSGRPGRSFGSIGCGGVRNWPAGRGGPRREGSGGRPG